MNIKTTIALVIIAAGCVALFWRGPELAPRLGLAPTLNQVSSAGSEDVARQLRWNKISRIEVRLTDNQVLELVGKPGEPLQLPNGWPARRDEVDELVELLTSLESRFVPIPLANDADLKAYGLDPSQKPIQVTVEEGPERHVILFGQPDEVAGENPFTRSTYARIDSKPELLRLGSDVMAIIQRPIDFYRRRQLFPDVEYLKVVGDNAPTPAPGRDANLTADAVSNDHVVRLDVVSPAGAYQLSRFGKNPIPKQPPENPKADAVVTTTQLAEAWRITQPIKDRVDPAKLKAILEAIPDLWVDRFIANPTPVVAAATLLTASNPLNAAGFAAVTAHIPQRLPADPGALRWMGEGDVGLALQSIAAMLPTGTGNGVGGLCRLASSAAFASEVYTPITLTVTLDSGKTRELAIGKVSRMSFEMKPAPPPMFPGQPPQPPQRVVTQKRFATLAQSSLFFEVRGDKLDALFFLKPSSQPAADEPIPESPRPRVALDELRDTQVARFDADTVDDIETVSGSHKVLRLHKTSGNPKAAKEEDKKDRWNLVEPYAALADAEKVKNKLLMPLFLRAGKSSIYDRTPLQAVIGGLVVADRQALGLTPQQAGQVEITSADWVALPKRVLLVGKHDPDTKKCWVQLQGDERINLVDDSVLTLLNLRALDFRSPNLFDLQDRRISEVAVQLSGSETFDLHEILDANITRWELGTPTKTLADTAKADQFVRDLADLKAIEFVDELKSPEELAVIDVAVGSIGAALVPSPAKYGLDKPLMTVTLRFTGSKTSAPVPERVLLIGKMREGKPEYYAQIKGDQTIFTIGIALPDLAKPGSVAFLPLQLWEGNDAEVRRIEITRGKANPYTLLRTGGGWEVHQPFSAKLNSGQIGPLVDSLANFRVERYEAQSAKNLADYGLDAPLLQIRFTMNRKTPASDESPAKEVPEERTLLIGNLAAAGKPGHFAKLADKPAIFVVSDLLFQDANKSAYDLLDRKLLSIPANTITGLQSTTAEGNVVLSKAAGTWKPEGAGFTVDKPTIDSIIKLLGNLNAVRFDAYGPTVNWMEYGLDDASRPATLTVKHEQNSHKIEMGKPVNPQQPLGDRFARVDGGPGVAVLAGPTAVTLSKGKLELVDRSLLKFDPLEVQAIRRTMDKSELELTQNVNGNWDITKPIMQKADQLLLEDTVERLGNLRADSIKAIDVKNLSDFGIDPPVATIKIEMLDKRGKTTEKILRLGKPVDPTKPDGDRFVMADASPVMAALNGDFAKRLLADPTKFRDRSLAGFVNADKIVVERGDRKATFLKSGGSWKLKEPIDAPAEDEALRELHDTLARLRADEMVAEKPTDLKKYGLDKPVRWQLFNGDKEVLNLLIGKKEGDRAYAKLDKSDLVVLLNPDLTKKLLSEYRKRALWETLDVAQAASIMLKTADGTGSFEFVKTPLGWIDISKPSDRLNNEAVSELLGAMSNLKADEFVADKGADLKLYGLDAPRTLTVSTQMGQKRTLLLGNVSESKRVYAKLDDPKRTDVFLLSVEDTRRINRDRAGFGLVAPKK